MSKLLWIGVGGALGAVLRYVVAGMVQKWWSGSFPLGTLVVNVVGCLLIGILATVFMGPVLVRGDYRLGILVGLLGGFTTFSTFAWESHALVMEGQFWYGSLNVVLNNGLGFLAAWVGVRVAMIWFGG